MSGKPLKKMKEESYFFRQSRFQERLVKHIEDNPEFIQPARRRNEILVRLREDDLRDLSVSRTTFDWGIPVPDAPGHVMYVWFDALTNYLTGTGWPQKPNGDGMWPASVHIIGKDIIWFHCVIWPCMLWSAGLPLPKTVFGHGFVTAADGQKMSKSIGNVVDPMDQLTRYSSDTFRYYLMRNAVYGSDVPFSESNLVYVHNSDLADVMGNLVHRATNLCNKNCGGAVPDCAVDVVFDVAALRVQSEQAMSNLEVQRCCELAINAMKDTNKYLTDSAPWAVKGDGAAERKAVIIRSTLEAVYAAAHFLAPFIPDACDAIFEKLGTPAVPAWKLKRSENLAPGTAVSVGDILFAKHEVEGADKGADKGAEGAKGGDAKGKKAADAPKPKKKEVPANAPVDVSRLNIVVGTVTKVARHPEAEKLYVESIDLGPALGTKQVVSGLVEHVPEDQMMGARVVVVANMKPSKMRGVESAAMVLCGTGPDGKVELVTPPEGVPNGEKVAFDAFPGEPDEVLNPKKKVFETVAPGFEVSAEVRRRIRGARSNQGSVRAQDSQGGEHQMRSEPRGREGVGPREGCLLYSTRDRERADTWYRSQPAFARCRPSQNPAREDPEMRVTSSSSSLAPQGASWRSRRRSDPRTRDAVDDDPTRETRSMMTVATLATTCARAMAARLPEASRGAERASTTGRPHLHRVSAARGRRASRAPLDRRRPRRRPAGAPHGSLRVRRSVRGRPGRPPRPGLVHRGARRGGQFAGYTLLVNAFTRRRSRWLPIFSSEAAWRASRSSDALRRCTSAAPSPFPYGTYLVGRLRAPVARRTAATDEAAPRRRRRRAGGPRVVVVGGESGRARTDRGDRRGIVQRRDAS